MCYPGFTQRIADGNVAAWDIHHRVLARVEQGEEVLLLSVGDFDFDTPVPTVQPAINNLLAGNTRYADVCGKCAPCQHIVERHWQRSGQAMDAEQVVVLAGAQCALYAVVQCPLSPGDKVIVAESVYATYEAVFDTRGAWVVPTPVCFESGFRVQVEKVTTLITSRTCAMMLSSPHNPSGVNPPRTAREALTELRTTHDLWMTSDEVYSELLFDGEHVNPAGLPGMAKRTAALNNLSKSHAIIGWRVGWMVGPVAPCVYPESLASCMPCGLPKFIQDATCTALEAPLPELETVHEAYRRRHDPAIRCLADSPDSRPLRPDGGMFVVVNIRPTGLPAQAFADRLLDRHDMSMLAGEAFGPSTTSHTRLDLVLGIEPLREVCRCIALCTAELFNQVWTSWPQAMWPVTTTRRPRRTY